MIHSKGKKNQQPITFSQFLQICEPQTQFIKGLNILFESVSVILLTVIVLGQKLDFLNPKSQNKPWVCNSFADQSERNPCETKSEFHTALFFSIVFRDTMDQQKFVSSCSYTIPHSKISHHLAKIIRVIN